MSSLSIVAKDKNDKSSTFSASSITREEVDRAKQFLDGLQFDEGHDPTKNSAGGSITGATSSSEPTAESSSKETAWTGKEGGDPKGTGKDKP